MVLYSLCVFRFIHFPTGGIFPRTSVNLPLYVRRPSMQGCLVTFCINTRRPLDYLENIYFQWLYTLRMYFSASNFQQAGYFLVLLFTTSSVMEHSITENSRDRESHRHKSCKLYLTTHRSIQYI